MALTVLFAVYGGLRNGGQDNTEAAIVTSALQTAIDNSPNGNGVVKINHVSLGVDDPAPHVQKHFGALIDFGEGANPQLRPFACLEGQTIDFT
jgi:hypothetical protein